MFIIDSTTVVRVCRVPGPVPRAGDTKISGHFPGFGEGTWRGSRCEHQRGACRAGRGVCAVLGVWSGGFRKGPSRDGPERVGRGS